MNPSAANRQYTHDLYNYAVQTTAPDQADSYVMVLQFVTMTSIAGVALKVSEAQAQRAVGEHLPPSRAGLTHCSARAVLTGAK